MRYALPLGRLLTLFSAALIFALGVHADEPVAPKLPPKLRQLLQQEMIAIRQASQDILDALVMGQEDIVAGRAQAIHDSFIMARSMNDEERQILRRTLPPEFVALDKSLHATAGALASAARISDRTAQLNQFAAMVNTCTACHRQFASDRFPGFAGQ